MSVRTSILARLVGLALVVAPVPALSATAPDLRGRISIDGLTGDFTADEVVFGLTASGQPEERPDDSVWGPLGDVRQIRITWDRRRLYLAAEGTIWDNNLVIAADVVPDRGLASMRNLNSWRRLFDFIPAFAPDLFCATWDGNTAPRLLLHLSGDDVSDNLPGTLFQAVATFQTDQSGRAMEFSIPWSTVYPGATRDTVLDPGGVPDTATVLPAFTELRLVAFVTGGPDGVSGPDSAPNNHDGHPVDYTIPVTIDNFATLKVDLDSDGLADIGVQPRSRVQFHDPTTPTRRTSWGRLKALFR